MRVKSRSWSIMRAMRSALERIRVAAFVAFWLEFRRAM